jgi:hypothetical protein
VREHLVGGVGETNRAENLRHALVQAVANLQDRQEARLGGLGGLVDRLDCAAIIGAIVARIWIGHFAFLCFVRFL